MITVAKDGSGDFYKVQDAVNRAEYLSKNDPEYAGETIIIRKGIYQEHVEIRVPKLSLVGEDAAETVIADSRYAHMPMPDIGKRGTFRSYTMLIDADQVQLGNLTVANTSGAGPRIGQAVALYADGDNLIFESVRLLGWQDTLFTGPLPEKEIEPHGFIGPKEHAPRINGHQYYKNCYIEGDIDFIFGSATAYFDHCTIFQKNRANLQTTALGPVTPEEHQAALHMEHAGFATAASTPASQHYGYVFNACQFLSDCPDKSCYLGRPWRNYANVVIMNSYIGPHIHPDGFHNWNKRDAEATVVFAEYNNEGPGADHGHRVPYVIRLSDKDAEFYTRDKVMQS